MRVLLDENLPRKLKYNLGAGVTASTVQEQGWAGTSNGEPLRIAQNEFEVFLTTDRGIPHQQNLSKFKIAIVLLKAPGNRFTDISPLLPSLRSVLLTIKPGTLVRVST